MVTEEGFCVGKARERIFCSLIMKFGNIKRGSLISKMGCSNSTFAHEYRDFLEAYPNIQYNIEKREFTYNP
jgi:hypothetical protein